MIFSRRFKLYINRVTVEPDNRFSYFVNEISYVDTHNIYNDRAYNTHRIEQRFIRESYKEFADCDCYHVCAAYNEYNEGRYELYQKTTRGKLLYKLKYDKDGMSSDCKNNCTYMGCNRRGGRRGSLYGRGRGKSYRCNAAKRCINYVHIVNLSTLDITIKIVDIVGKRKTDEYINKLINKYCNRASYNNHQYSTHIYYNGVLIRKMIT